MFVPSSKSKRSLLLIFVVCILLFYWVETSRVFLREKYFSEKLAAAQLMQDAMKVLKDYRIAQGVFIEELNDPNKTALIGEKETLITTDRGSLTAKLTSLNPNFAAVIIDLFKKAKLRKGDKVSFSCTGSFPALNIAVMSAAKVLDLDLIMISSVGASMFGATDPDFTWLDMESVLNENGIFQYKSVATSIGGGRDLGRGLSKTGRNLIIEAAQMNNILLIQENTLEQNILKKMGIFNSKGKIKLYVNVGGGLSSLGNAINGRLVKPGFHRYIYLKNIPLKGTMFLFADMGVPVIHLLDIISIAETYELPVAPVPLPKPGNGRVFLDERYSVNIAAIALTIIVILILVIIFFDHKYLKLKEDEKIM